MFGHTLTIHYIDCWRLQKVCEEVVFLRFFLVCKVKISLLSAKPRKTTTTITEEEKDISLPKKVDDDDDDDDESHEKKVSNELKKTRWSTWRCINRHSL